MYKLIFTGYFKKKLAKLIKHNPKVDQKIETTLQLLSVNPLEQKLCSHKVGEYWSSRVTGDIRIIWIYGEDREVRVLELFDIGGHSGNRGVY
jgi:mRNA-degrading endonuclease YafQ of YafQ-DinJ toxin-antitoxin module